MNEVSSTTKIVVLDEVQARWLSDVSRTAHNYRYALLALSSDAIHQLQCLNGGFITPKSVGPSAMDVQMYFGALKTLLTQKWSIFLIANLNEDNKEAAIEEINDLVNIALGPANTKSIKSLDGFTWFKRGFTLDNF